MTAAPAGGQKRNEIGGKSLATFSGAAIVVATRKVSLGNGGLPFLPADGAGPHHPIHLKGRPLRRLRRGDAKGAVKNG
jgi:hypothetical protein